MKSRWLLGVVALAMIGSLLAGDAWARRPGGGWTPPDPAELAPRFVEQLTQIGDHGAEHNARAAERCVAVIEELLAAGNVEAAERAADFCIGHINRKSDRCVRLLGGLTRSYVRILERLGAGAEVIASVKQAGEAAAETVRRSQDEAIAAINAALPVLPPE